MVPLQVTNPRPNQVRGERHGRARLTAADVIAIRRAYRAGVSIATLAKRRNMSRRAIGKIVKRETWAHLPPVEVHYV